MAAWRDIAALRDPDRFEAWLRRLLVRACYREARRERARRLVEVHVPAIDRGTPDVSRDLADRDELERGFRALAPDQRAILVLHYYLGPAHRGDGRCPAPAHRDREVRLHRTTQVLRARLDADARAGGLIGERPA